MAEVRQFPGNETLLLTAYLIPFVVVLVLQFVYALSWSPGDFDTAKSYPATEWLINYQGGFLRRGLPGNLLFLLMSVLQMSPVVLTLLLSTGLFLIFCWYLFASLRGMSPRWLLLTAPLLGYPVYVDYILGRKDVFLVLLLALCLRLVVRGGDQWWCPLMVALIMTLAVLSHESMALVGLPALVAMILLKALADFRGPWISIVMKECRKWSWLIVPVMAIGISLQRKGTLAQGQQIIDSLRFSLPPAARYFGAPGAIGWIGRPVELYVSEAHEALGRLHFGVPTWIYLIAIAGSGIVFIASVLAWRDDDVGVFFLLACLFQLAAIMPLFYLAKDHGRWLSISLLTAFIITIESTASMRAFCSSRLLRPFSSFLHSVPRPLPPIGLAFWGVPIGISSLHQIIYSAPAGSLLKVYFLLRVMGLPDPTSLWRPAG
ncbi:hypothetical protein [Cyanobium gracile]|uniref:Glycosyltransferase RgtA/B/C/D-like domain-containing protein n=1 Tax=Cyanobium gracile UHCC 0281 TaxID=3110309 RepID=A0ABU5SY77_9CYAN|nr:hypothetical protein [Cyanobium gracile]MEA5443482.1 hypothetical protein [Cyanobium gracile UHCC 0281]